MERCIDFHLDEHGMTRNLLDYMLNHAIGDSTVSWTGPLFGSLIMFVGADFALNPDMVLDDVPHCTGDLEDVRDPQVSWYAPNPDVDGNPNCIGYKTGGGQFLMTTFDPGQTVYGVAFVGDDSVTLNGVAMLDDPFVVETGEWTPFILSVGISAIEV